MSFQNLEPAKCQPSPILLQIKNEKNFQNGTHIWTLDNDGYCLFNYASL